MKKKTKQKIKKTTTKKTKNKKTNKKKQQKNKDRKMQKSDTSYSESVRAKWFYYAFKVRFCPINM